MIKFLTNMLYQYNQYSQECLSHSSYGMSGLAPLMNVLFWERDDFNVSFSDTDIEIVPQEVL